MEAHSLCSSPGILSDFPKKAGTGMDPSEPSGCFILAGKTSLGSVSTATTFPSLWHSGSRGALPRLNKSQQEKKPGKARPQQPKARDQGLSGPLGKQENGGKAGKGAVPALPPAPAAPAGKVWKSRDVALERIQPGTKAWDAAKGIFPARGTTQGMLRSRDEGRSNGRPFLPTKTRKSSGFSWIWG